MKRKFTAVMPISAYPFHWGHAGLFQRAEEIFGKGKVLILVCNNSSKSYSAYDRMRFFRQNKDCLHAEKCEGLVADYCLYNGIKFIVRGVRNTSDFDYEMNIRNFNELFDIQTIFIFPPPGDERISSTEIRELLKYGKIEEASVLCPAGMKKDLEKTGNGVEEK